MNELVFVKNDEVVTDSQTIADVFGKEHKHVLRDIKNLECSEEFSQSNFGPSTYQVRGKEYPMYYITQDGFSFLVMGYTGKTAAQFKEKYITEFRRMEKKLNEPKVLSDKEQLIASMKLSLETSEELGDIKTKVSGLEERFDNELTLNHGQATSLNHAIKKRVEHLWSNGVTGSLETKRQMYSNIHSHLRRGFQAPTYREVKRVDFDDAIQWVSAWRPL
ncbi:Rha family transcriptional regulator [Halobacillus karajensis]|uniref:Phage regulatory protein, Rha family n=1 Tax=Halobacillus karajensis TaxID=195088 RepID=A0A059NUY6_9BACI|nr:Rha family transcriptional regulator [Halobacillus karajensis]CDQ22614.1 phage regulatory protein, Rha family [Halobacillus karajensis]CDQ26096.1 phage regulatory protein, Rha family [Halobacillus karajensis]